MICRFSTEIMKSIIIKTAICGGILFSIAAIFLASYPQVIGYWRFMMRSQRYYTQIADACDSLVARAESSPHEISGIELRSLPAVLRDLNPDHVIIQTNLVMVRVGGGQVSYSFVWKAQETDASWWQLRVSSGDRRHSRSVFARRSPGSLN